MKVRLLTIFLLSVNLLSVGCADDRARQQLADTNVQVSQLQQNVKVLNNKVSNQNGLEVVNTLNKLQNDVDQLNGEISNLKSDFYTHQNFQKQSYQGLQQQIDELQQRLDNQQKINSQRKK